MNIPFLGRETHIKKSKTAFMHTYLGCGPYANNILQIIQLGKLGRDLFSTEILNDTLTIRGIFCSQHFLMPWSRCITITLDPIGWMSSSGPI